MALNEAEIPHRRRENVLMNYTIEILNETRLNILSEVLKCDVCFELPRGKEVRICEKGHHFCLSCHKKMKVCGICRGNLLKIRNFAVEQLVTKLGPILDLPKCKLPSMESPVNLSPGFFHCPHGCSTKMPAFRMLPHLRSHHSNNLIDDVRSNPYSERFSFSFDIPFVKDDKYVWSAQVSDMGLFTVELIFSGSDFFGCARILGDKTASSLFRYQLVAKIPNKLNNSYLELGVTDCPVLSYSDDIESIRGGGNGLNVPEAVWLKHVTLETAIPIFFSVWKEESQNKKESVPSITCLPKRHLFFQSDRKVRRNRNRNIRRKRLREKMKNLASLEEMSETVTKGLSRLSL